LDDLCGTSNTLVARAGKRLHDRGIHSCPARSRSCRGIDQNNFWTQTSITAAIWKGREVRREQDR
jgi:hypothetical protein